MADFYAPQNPGLAAFIQPYLSWRERQANESRLADLMLPKAIPDYLAGLAYGTNPSEPPLTSWRSTLAYGLPAVEALGIAPALRPLARGGLAAYGALERRMLPPAGQLNMMVGPGARAEFLNQADPAVRAMITDQLKMQGLRDVQITDGVIRDEIARRNAATMLGLPAENTAADRAAAMGFDTPAYHGTKADISSFSNKGSTTGSKSSKQAFFFSDNPQTAGEYADLASKTLNLSPVDKLKVKKLRDEAFYLQEKGFKYPQDSKEFQYYRDKQYELYDEISKIESSASGGDTIYPVMLSIEDLYKYDYGGNEFRDKTYNELLRLSKNKGYGGVSFKNTMDNSSGNIENIYALNKANKIRSRFAAFDPARAKEADILAGIAGLSFIPALTLQDYFRQD